jgi:D-alanyl-D-alanine carboxypeptidase
MPAGFDRLAQVRGGCAEENSERRVPSAAMLRARAGLVLLLVSATLTAGAPPALGATSAGEGPVLARAKPKWVQRIDELVAGRPISVAIGNDGDWWYRNLAWVKRPPASNQKLLLSMALFNRFGAERKIRTQVFADGKVEDGILRGDLWLIGHGDPETGRRELQRLADAVVGAGIDRVRGSVMGFTGAFARDWWAPGWQDYFPDVYIPLPTALTYLRNRDASGRHVTDPERRAAVTLTKMLRSDGVFVRDPAGAGRRPSGLRPVATILSEPLRAIVRRMNFDSRNLWAEVLGKYIGMDRLGRGTIANGARSICAYTAARGLDFTCHDSSGLSFDNRATALGIVQLIWKADETQWGDVLRASLPRGGQGTLEDRLTQIRIRAKTGTLIDVSALSGWVWLQRSNEWAEFSILSSNIDDSFAKTIENQIVKVVSANASDPD